MNMKGFFDVLITKKFPLQQSHAITYIKILINCLNFQNLITALTMYKI